MLTCPICLDIFRVPMYIKGCSHRFCKDCIEKALRQVLSSLYFKQTENKACPTCRKQIKTKRLLRIDTIITEMSTSLFGNVIEYIQN